MRPVHRHVLLLLVVTPAFVFGQPPAGGPAGRTDYLTFAQGAVPVAIGGDGAKLGATFEHAVRIIDGDTTNFTFVNRASAGTATEFVYQLPASTTFDRFAVPDIRETPSPNQTFARLIEIHGSPAGPDAGYTLLASAALRTHARRTDITEIAPVARLPVTWVKLRLVGGINIATPESFFSFSEIIGNGVQETPALVDHFKGTWLWRGTSITLRQAGPVVTGCYDRNGVLSGTVIGNILRATGIDSDDNTKSIFILSVVGGDIRGVRSTNGAPFRVWTVPAAAAGAPGPRCADPSQPAVGCGSIIHGITFDLDSAVIRPESEPVLAELFKALSADRSAAIVIEGHTSSEGTDTYNLGLSERRAQAVVADLTRRGLAAARMRAVGAGEVRPIASNNDENGRSMNRRVEVQCR
jgi:outer membrane protein OmpA-like peptidoglycan-associated protein